MTRVAKWVAVALVVGCSSTVAWWLIGDLSEDILSPDYVIKPADIARSTENLIGIVSAIVLLGALVVLRVTTARISRRSFLALVPLVIVGVFAAFTARVFTAGVSGANIGAGVVAFFAVPFVPTMLIVSYFVGKQSRSEVSAS